MPVYVFFSFSIVLHDTCSLARRFKVTWTGNNGIAIISGSVSAACDRLSIRECNCGQTDISSCLHAFAYSCDPQAVARTHRQCSVITGVGLIGLLKSYILRFSYILFSFGFFLHHSYH